MREETKRKAALKKTEGKALIVKKSGIHGRGVFAGRRFRKGEVVIKWDLRQKIKKLDIPKLSPSTRNSVYFFRGRYIIPSSPGRYLNHSCDSNTVARDGFDVAKRNIRKNEEITIDFLSEKILHRNFHCHCGSRKCVKVVKKTIQPNPQKHR